MKLDLMVCHMYKVNLNKFCFAAFILRFFSKRPFVKRVELDIIVADLLSRKISF